MKPGVKRTTYGMIALLLAFFSLATAFGARPASAETDEEIAGAFLNYYAPQTETQEGASRAASQTWLGERRDDATFAQLRLLRNWDRLQPETREKLADVIQFTPARDGKRYVLAGPSYTTCMSLLETSVVKTEQTEHFKVYYTLSGVHAVGGTITNGVPTYISDVLTILEQTWNHEVNVLGLPAPPLPAGNRYDIYVCDLFGAVPGVLGRTNTTETNGLSAQSFIEIDNDYTNTNPTIHLYNGITIMQLVEVIVAHEFFHAIQFGMNWSSPSYWLMEMSATWMEDEVYPDVNDYVPQYLSDRFANTYVSIDHFSNYDVYAYGSSAFLKYITEHVGGRAFVPTLWLDLQTACTNTQNYPWCAEAVTEIPLISTSLADLSTTLPAVFRDYSTAIFTKDFVDGPIYPAVTTQSLGSSYPIQRNDSLDHLAARYYTLTAPAGTQTHRLSLGFTGSSSASWEVAVVTIGQDGSKTVNNMTLNSGSGAITLPGFGASFTSTVVIVNNVHATANGKSYTLNITAPVGCGIAETSASISTGWHLISLPLIPDNTSVASGLNLGVGEYLLAYDSGSQQLVDSVNNNPAFPGIGAAGRGFWLNRTVAGALTSLSCPNQNAEQTILLKSGWNIIGNPFGSQVAWGDAKISAALPSAPNDSSTLASAEDKGWLSGSLYDWNGVSYSVWQPNNGYSLEPWKGYWLKAKQDVVLKIAAP
ncbi:MAG: MXAN_6640 family putative metalloprotease [bacterium]